MSGGQINAAVNRILQVFGVYTGSTRLMVFHHDRVAANSVAYNVLALAGPALRDGPCFSHTADHGFGHLNIPEALRFSKLWRKFFGKSDNLRLRWTMQSDDKLVFSAETRWWSEHEALVSIGALHARVPKGFLTPVHLVTSFHTIIIVGSGGHMPTFNIICPP